MTDLAIIYAARFENTGLDRRTEVWKVLCSDFFQKFVDPKGSVLDLACGYGEFINNIVAAKKYGLDLNPDSPLHLDGDVTFLHSPATDLSAVPDGTLDVAFTSNFLEHLPSKEVCNEVFAEVRRKLRPGGRFLIMGPNIRYVYAQYWDYYDHYLPLSHLSLAEGLLASGYQVDSVYPKFLPYTMNNKVPAHPALVRAYLKVRPAWSSLGKQFFVVARRPT